MFVGGDVGRAILPFLTDVQRDLDVLAIAQSIERLLAAPPL
jgi:hypothetical protein